MEGTGLNLPSTRSGNQAAVRVDTVCSDSPPGILHHLQPGDQGAFLNSVDSARGRGVPEMSKLAETLNRNDIPDSIPLLGIEIASVEPGQEISAAVQSALPEAGQRLDDLVRSLLSWHPRRSATVR